MADADDDRTTAERLKDAAKDAAATAKSKLPGGTPDGDTDRPPSPSGAGAPGYVDNEEIEAEHQQD